MQRIANTTQERIVLRVDAAKKKAFLEMLKLFDFVEVESLEEQMNRYVEHAPTKVTLTDDEIMQEIQAVRKRKKGS